MKHESFIEVLKSEVRNDLKREIELENIERSTRANAPQRLLATAQHEQLGTWLATHLQPLAVQARAYPAFTGQRAKTQNPTVTGATSIEESDENSAHGKSSLRDKRADQRAERRASPQAEPRLQVRTAHEALALQILNRAGASLTEIFTANELKKSWRMTALKHHPDRHLNADAREIAKLNIQFSELLTAVETLTQCTPA